MANQFCMKCQSRQSYICRKCDGCETCCKDLHTTQSESWVSVDAKEGKILVNQARRAK